LYEIASSPCFAGLLAMTLLLKFLVELYTIHSNMHRHCEEPRDEAICLNNNKRNYRIIIIEPTPSPSAGGDLYDLPCAVRPESCVVYLAPCTLRPPYPPLHHYALTPLRRYAFFTATLTITSSMSTSRALSPATEGTTDTVVARVWEPI